MREQRLDFTAQAVVFGACLGEKICALVGGKRRCRVIESICEQAASKSPLAISTEMTELTANIAERPGG